MPLRFAVAFCCFLASSLACRAIALSLRARWDCSGRNQRRSGLPWRDDSQPLRSSGPPCVWHRMISSAMGGCRDHSHERAHLALGHAVPDVLSALVRL